MGQVLRLIGENMANELDALDLAGVFSCDLQHEPQFARLPL